MTSSTAAGVRRASSDRGVAILCAAGVGLTLTYLAATLRIPLWRYFPGEEGISLDFVKMLGPDSNRVTAEYVGLVLATFALYAVALVAAWRRTEPIPRWVLFGFPVAFALVLIPMYPPTAVDLIHYHHSSRVLWLFGQNPLVVPPETFPYPIAHYWSFQPSPYGPLWSVLGGVATLPTQDHFIAGIMGFKAIAAASLLGCAYLIRGLASRAVEAAPGRRFASGDLAVVLFAWNPFVLLRVVGNGHNDLTMMFFVLLAFVLIEARRSPLAFIALAAAILVKFVALLLVPLFLIYVWHHASGGQRERIREAATGGVICVLFVVAGFAPFWAGLETLDTVRNEGSKLITSTAVAISAWMTDAEDRGLAREILVWLRVLFVALAAVAWWRSRRNFDALVNASFVVLFLYLVLGTGWFRPWYMLWPVTIAALRPRSWLAPMLLAITFFGSFPDLIEQYRNGWTFIDSYGQRVVAPVIVAFVPPLVVWTLVALRGASPRVRTLVSARPGRSLGN